MTDLMIITLLGNPGKRYETTRHNVGWWVGDLLAVRAGAAFQRGPEGYASAEVSLEGKPVLLVKPLTYMNNSGDAVAELRGRLEFRPEEQLLVIADDIALPLGQLRVRSSGSSGGHNGLQSIIDAIGSQQFARVRCGVGPVPPGIDPAEFVLDPFPLSELPLAQEMAVRAADAVRTILREGITAAANTYNRKPPAPDAPEGDDEGANRPREGQ
jgi:PTH1 family peptidyl-tRNA hydrolase